ncbi:hypothetical protein [Halosimplex halobium]|uniref:hypothetical protein n=1 Tax=Halosimplex halobium TaxID=3396618 RepID=UPI003F5672BD
MTTTPTVVYANQEYHEFVSVVGGEAEADAEVPIRVRGWTIGENNSLVMILDLTAKSKNDLKRAKQVNILITSGYVQAVAHHDTGKIGGEMTDGLRILEINNTGAPPKTVYINNSLARKYYTDQIDVIEFQEQYWDTKRNMTSKEIKFAYDFMQRSGNVTLHNESAN